MWSKNGKFKLIFIGIFAATSHTYFSSAFFLMKPTTACAYLFHFSSVHFALVYFFCPCLSIGLSEQLTWSTFASKHSRWEIDREKTWAKAIRIKLAQKSKRKKQQNKNGKHTKHINNRTLSMCTCTWFQFAKNTSNKIESITHRVNKKAHTVHIL